MKRIWAIAMLLFVFAGAVWAQEDFSFPVKFKGKSPAVGDFLLALSDSQEDPGELLTSIGKNWKAHRRGRKCVGRFVAYDRYRYASYVRSETFGGSVRTDTTEFCCWDFCNQRKKMVAVAHRDFADGKVIAGQYSGLSLYVYDMKTRRMGWVSSEDMGVEMLPVNGVHVYSISEKDKCIRLSAFSQEEGFRSVTYVWDGSMFTPKNPDK